MFHTGEQRLHRLALWLIELLCLGLFMGECNSLVIILRRNVGLRLYHSYFFFYWIAWTWTPHFGRLFLYILKKNGYGKLKHINSFGKKNLNKILGSWLVGAGYNFAIEPKKLFIDEILLLFFYFIAYFSKRSTNTATRSAYWISWN